jgi:hypothetical protein|tara:strand:+ start:4605 stop:5153 length:549 start_codon:yes stop_codon:yes gene_type:complete
MREIEELKQTLDRLVDSGSDLNILLEFEEVLDNLNIYAYKNWEYGEILAGPEVTKYWINVTLMWPRQLMPDPDGALRLTKHGARVFFKKDDLIEPVKIVTQDDLEGETGPDGKRRPKKKKTPVWTVTIEMPRSFVDDFESSKITINGTDIDLSEVDGAYNTDQGNNLAPEKDDIMDDIGEME